ncbi:GL14178 [Drosophila persimilis]|uniref:GL14178 n=1 Tax=Drosophila persimilis TaxID=7234 RepID=B4GTZ3_DROPE|nr:GL14178 [Drosophila persimilis]
MTDQPSTDETGGGVATHFFARLMRLTGVSLSSAAAAAAPNSMPEPTTSSLMTTESPTTAAAELAPSYLIDRVTQVARIALEVTTTASEVLAEALPEVDTSFANGTIHGNLTLAAAAAANYENCSAIFANYTQPEADLGTRIQLSVNEFELSHVDYKLKADKLKELLGIYCNFTWDTLTCWPPTPAGVMARMHCPAGFHGVDPRTNPVAVPQTLVVVSRRSRIRHIYARPPYVLLEYARTAMFMWMFIEGLYLHNMVTVAVFQGQFPLKFFSRLGWCVPILMTTVWARCTVMYMDTSMGECLWNYNLTPYYWILEGPRLAVILLNFCFLVNIIRVLVMKLRQSQASDIEQTRKAVRAAIVLLPLLGITNLLHQWPVLKSATNFAVWSYGTHFLTSFQGFFIALIYCFLNGEVRACLLKSLSNQLSLRGHPEWAPKRPSMYSGAYNTAPDTDAVGQQPVAETQAATGGLRTSPINRRQNTSASIVMIHEPNHRQRLVQRNHNNNNQESPRRQRGERTDDEDRIGIAAGAGVEAEVVVVQDSVGGAVGRKRETRIHAGTKWMISGLCFRGQKVLRVPSTSSVPPESVVFELSEQ